MIHILLSCLRTLMLPSSITPDLPKTDTKGRSAVLRVKLSQELTDKACRRCEVSEAAFFLSAFYYMTARLTNSDDVYISTISSGRSDVRFSDTYGMFVNTLPIGASLTFGSVDEFIKKTAQDFEEAVKHENYPFAEVSDKWGVTVEIMYAYQRGIVETPKIPGLKNILDGDLELVCEITGYDVKATAVTADELASQNRLTVTVKVNFTNNKYPEDNVENKSFSAYEDFDATLTLDAVEGGLCETIVDKLVEDIFNATVAQW